MTGFFASGITPYPNNGTRVELGYNVMKGAEYFV